MSPGASRFPPTPANRSARAVSSAAASGGRRRKACNSDVSRSLSNRSINSRLVYDYSQVVKKSKGRRVAVCANPIRVVLIQTDPTQNSQDVIALRVNFTGSILPTANTYTSPEASAAIAATRNAR